MTRSHLLAMFHLPGRMVSEENPDSANISRSPLLRIAKYSDNEFRSAGILPAVSGASRSRPARGQDAHAQRARRPRYEKSSSLYFAILWVTAVTFRGIVTPLVVA